MKNKLLASFIVNLIFLTGLFAHHSGTWADNEHPITLTGTVTEFTFTNPHVLMTLAVKGQSGTTEKWVVEFNSPQSVRRSGLTAVSVKPGDEIVISGSPAKDGRKLMSSMGNRKLSINGRELELRRGE